MQTATLNFKDVLQSATSKGYDSILCCIARYGGSAMLPHSVTDGAAQLCELTLIQKWLREKEQININIKYSPQIATNWFATVIVNFASLRPKVKDYRNFNSYETALLHGVNEALNTLKVI